MKFTLKIVFKNGYTHESNHKWENMKNKQELHNKFLNFIVSDKDAFCIDSEDGIHYFIKSEITCISIIETN